MQRSTEKWIRDLDVRAITIKLLEENRRIRNSFLGIKIQKNRKIGLHQNLTLLYIKGCYQEYEKTPHSIGKKYANHVSDKGLVSTT